MALKIAAFDIDGTLLNSDRELSENNKQALISLGERGVLRVAATGRNLFSLKGIFAIDFPIDYAVFSSGAGVINWETKEIFYYENLLKKDVVKILKFVGSLKLNFLVKEGIPNSHYMHYSMVNKENQDLMNYVNHYKEFARPIFHDNRIVSATQFIIEIGQDKALYSSIKAQLSSYKSVLTTSPIDNKTLWVELFHRKVSKANGMQVICDQHQVKRHQVFCIGNDYNDLDMLNYFENSYVVANSPADLTKMFAVVESNDNDGFAKAVKEVFEIED